MEGWIALTRTSSLKPDVPVKISLKNKNYAVWKHWSSNEIQMVPDQCRHRGASLSLGTLSNDGCVTCPYHGWKTKASKIVQPWDGLIEYTLCSSNQRSKSIFCTRVFSHAGHPDRNIGGSVCV